MRAVVASFRRPFLRLKRWSPAIVFVGLAGLIVLHGLASQAPESSRNRSGGSDRLNQLEWDSLSFQSIGDQDSLRAAAAAATSLVDPLTLDKRMRDEVALALERFLRAYTSGEFGDYTRFCAPCGHQGYKPGIVEFLHKVLIAQGRLQPSDPASNPEEIARLYWTGDAKSNPRETPRFARYLEAIAFGETPAEIRRVAKWPTPQEISGQLETMNPHQSLIGLVATHSTSPGLEELRKRQGFVDMLSVHMFVKPRLPDPVFAVSVFYFWNPDCRAWIPNDLFQLTRTSKKGPLAL